MKRDVCTARRGDTLRTAELAAIASVAASPVHVKRSIT
jgi:hypothetical protein